MNNTEIRMYEIICRNDGIKAAEVAKQLGVERKDINHLLYCSAFIHELCYRDREYRWHGLIRQTRPHFGLYDFCGFYDTVSSFMSLTEEEWMEQLMDGCRRIGRNLNDTRGLLHSFRDARQTMRNLFMALKTQDVSSWEICFELRIRRSKHIRIYADVLVITENRVFSLEYKMKDKTEPEELKQAVKYSRFLDVIFGSDYEVIPALVLTRAGGLYTWEQLPDSDLEVPVCSGDKLADLFAEFTGCA